ncbi:hypothetical protein, partial [Cronobacter sakazakii]|uniref:hypothetical protein n=1 Tax=Cronobacter sakazakii TaxID=28141 RepID=UPI001CEDD625
LTIVFFKHNFFFSNKRRPSGFLPFFWARKCFLESELGLIGGVLGLALAGALRFPALHHFKALSLHCGGGGWMVGALRLPALRYYNALVVGWVSVSAPTSLTKRP